MKSSPVKPLLLTFLLLYSLITLAPAAVYAASRSPQAPLSPTPAPSVPEASPPPATPSPAAGSSPGSVPAHAPVATPQPSPEHSAFTLADAATGQTLTVPDREFLAAAIACEMDLNAPQEALKAQAVAAYTYYSRQRQTGQPIACDTANWLVYVPASAMQERWGEDFDRYQALLDQVVDQVFGQTLTYGDELALTAYFAISPGSTEAVENVWSPDAGEDHPYLQAVASPGDAFSDGYLSEAHFTPEEFREAAEEAFPQADLTGPVEEWLTGPVYTPSGMAKTAVLGGTTVSGGDLRGALGLRSASFTFTVDQAGFHFTVKGWGHGVGMSQAGAVFLAKRGADYREILAHYYPGTELKG